MGWPGCTHTWKGLPEAFEESLRGFADGPVVEVESCHADGATVGFSLCASFDMASLLMWIFF